MSAAGSKDVLIALVSQHPHALPYGTMDTASSVKSSSPLQLVQQTHTCTLPEPSKYWPSICTHIPPTPQNTGGYLGTQVLRPERLESIYMLLYLPTLNSFLIKNTMKIIPSSIRLLTP